MPLLSLAFRRSHFSRQVPPSATTQEILAAKVGTVGECVCVYIYIYICVCVCVCVWKDRVRGQGRRRKQLLDDLEEKRRYWLLKEEALDRGLWRHRFGRGFAPFVRIRIE